MLELIESKLLEVLDKVYYGSASDKDNLSLWNYIVFWRDRTSRNTNKTGYTDYFTVNIVHENWVADEMIEAVIEQMESISGMRLANESIDFNYTRKPSTDAVIEIASVSFCRPRKRA